TSGPTTVRFDELRLVTLCPTASVSPEAVARTVSAAGGDVAIPIELGNTADHERSYRVFLSSTIGVDRQTLESAMHAAGPVATIDELQGAAGSDGGLGAAELFAADGSGAPPGPSIAVTGTAIRVAAHATWRGVIVHHVTAGMLGYPTTAMS